MTNLLMQEQNLLLDQASLCHCVDQMWKLNITNS